MGRLSYSKRVLRLRREIRMFGVQVAKDQLALRRSAIHPSEEEGAVIWLGKLLIIAVNTLKDRVARRRLYETGHERAREGTQAKCPSVTV